MLRAALLATLLLATPASAGVWDDASATQTKRDAQQTYDLAMRIGDEHVIVANVEGGSISERKRQLALAMDDYRRAAAALPDDAEPYFRMAEAIFSFYLDQCDSPLAGRQPSPFRDCNNPDAINQAAAEQYLSALAEAETRAPLDPRFSAGDGSLLFDRALIHTRMATEEHWRLAAKDYEGYILRVDVGDAGRLETPWSNLAETYMMLGMVDEAIDAYRTAIGYGATGSTAYGLAVALDRAGREQQAKEVILHGGMSGYESFAQYLQWGVTFFVPYGERFYYLGLAEETLGDPSEALQYWYAFLQSGAHPRFQPRAREHVAAIMKQLAGQKRTPPPTFEELQGR